MIMAMKPAGTDQAAMLVQGDVLWAVELFRRRQPRSTHARTYCGCALPFNDSIWSARGLRGGAYFPRAHGGRLGRTEAIPLHLQVLCQ